MGVFVNQVVVQYLCYFVKYDDQANWPELLQFVKFVYKNYKSPIK